MGDRAAIYLLNGPGIVLENNSLVRNSLKVTDCLSLWSRVDIKTTLWMEVIGETGDRTLQYVLLITLFSHGLKYAPGYKWTILCFFVQNFLLYKTKL